MRYLVGNFTYPGIKVAWVLEDEKHEVSVHRQYDYEELCFENVKPVVHTFVDPIVARDEFLSIVQEFMVK